MSIDPDVDPRGPLTASQHRREALGQGEADAGTRTPDPIITSVRLPPRFGLQTRGSPGVVRPSWFPHGSYTVWTTVSDQGAEHRRHTVRPSLPSSPESSQVGRPGEQAWVPTPGPDTHPDRGEPHLTWACDRGPEGLPRPPIATPHPPTCDESLGRGTVNLRQRQHPPRPAEGFRAGPIKQATQVSKTPQSRRRQQHPHTEA